MKRPLNRDRLAEVNLERDHSRRPDKASDKRPETVGAVTIPDLNRYRVKISPLPGRVVSAPLAATPGGQMSDSSDTSEGPNEG